MLLVRAVDLAARRPPGGVEAANGDVVGLELGSGATAVCAQAAVVVAGRIVKASGSILVTVVVQGSSLGLLIRLTGVRRTEADAPPMDLFAAERAMMTAQLEAVERLSRDEDGNVVHLQLLRRYIARATARDTFTGTVEERRQAIAYHFDVIIGTVRAGREELVKLHRAGRIDDETLRSLELDLDLEELGAGSAKA